jgi:hypothetical protein
LVIAYTDCALWRMYRDRIDEIVRIETRSFMQSFFKERIMTHEDAGNYTGKRSGARLNERIAAKIKEIVSDNKISCAEAHDVAGRLNISPDEVGTAIDLLEVRIIKCQLGLFGHGKEKNIPPLPDKINTEVESTIKSSLMNGRLACSTAWEIARRFKMPKPAMAAVCESMKIKISPCQLGAFG